jgi:glycosyltransferase involved in cell wall biosynthesis
VTNDRSPTSLLVDARNISSPGGAALQVELARSIAARRPKSADVVFVTASPDALRGIDRTRIAEVTPPSGWAGMWWWFNRELPHRARALRANVVYAPGGIVSSVVCRRFPTIVGVNNMLPFTPEQIRHFPPWSKDRLRLVLLQRLYSASCRRCNAVVVPSRFAIDQMRPYAGDLSHKSYVAPNSIPHYVVFEPESPPPRPHDGKPYFFYLSVVFWYKNHLELIEGFRRALRTEPGLPDLIMAGVPTQDSYVKRIRSALAAPELAGRARFLGKIPREDIPGWLHHATVNVFPSACETNSFIQAEIFGAHGVMACSNLGPMPEVAAGAAELFDPNDPDSIAATLIRLWRDEDRRRELRELSRRRASELTPDVCGEAVWNAVERARSDFRPRRA